MESVGFVVARMKLMLWIRAVSSEVVRSNTGYGQVEIDKRIVFAKLEVSDMCYMSHGLAAAV